MNVISMLLRSFVANFAILKHLRAFVANWLMLQFTRFLHKILTPKLQSRKRFDKYHVWRIYCLVKQYGRLSANDICNNHKMGGLHLAYLGPVSSLLKYLDNSMHILAFLGALHTTLKFRLSEWNFFSVYLMLHH